ncbi:hypothetical protein FQZ97_801050 [compost metagenome]
MPSQHKPCIGFDETQHLHIADLDPVHDKLRLKVIGAFPLRAAIITGVFQSVDLVWRGNSCNLPPCFFVKRCRIRVAILNRGGDIRDHVPVVIGFRNRIDHCNSDSRQNSQSACDFG